MKNRSWILKLLAEIPDSVGLEIGVWEGSFSKQLLEAVRPKRLFLVDPWKHDPRYPDRRYGKAGAEAMEQRYREVLARFAKVKSVSVLREESENVWDELPRLDWAYIDGNHSFEYVLADLKGAHRQLVPGGLIVGDDCHLPPDRRWAGVFEALLAFLRSEEGYGYRVEALREKQFVIRKPTEVTGGRLSGSMTGTAGLAGQVPGNKKRQLFAILSKPRTGTHLLRSYLDSHPDIRCEGEIFHPRIHWPHLEGLDEATSAREVLVHLHREASRFCRP